MLQASPTVFSSEPQSTDSPAEKILFEKLQPLPSWKLVASEDASWRETGGDLEIQLEGETPDTTEQYPRVTLTGPPLDLSDYSQLVFEVDNPLDFAQSFAVAIKTGSDGYEGQVAVLPPRSSSKIRLNISDGASLDQSSVSEVMLVQIKPIVRHIWRLKKITAVKNPDFISRRAALKQQLAQLRRDLELLKTAPKNEGIEESIRNAENVLELADKRFADRSPGYAPIIQKELIRVGEILSRTAIVQRGKELVVWSSPLGLPIRRGTLPSVVDSELSKIDELVCLNQYRAVCLNFSAGEKRQSLRVKLRAPEGLVSLRPTLFVTARDGTETADAIGLPCREATLTVEPYQTEQLLVWVDTKISGLSAGEYRGALEITDEGASNLEIPIHVEVADVRLVSRPPALLSNWVEFYTGNTLSTSGLESETVANLRDYGMTGWNLHYSQTPLPRLDPQGAYDGLEESGLKAFSKVMDLLQYQPEEYLIIWLGFHSQELRDALRRPGVLEGYLKDLTALLDEYDVPLDKRYLMLWDEPKVPEMRESIEWMAKIKEIAPSFRLYDNGTAIPTDEDELNKFAKYIDRWLPNWDQLFVGRPEDAARFEASGTRHRGFYRCLMSRNNRGVNIYEYYRLMPWHLMERGFDTLGFWVHNVGDSDEWDGRKGSSSGGLVVYSKEGKLFSSRRWELFREGLEDYKISLAAFGGDGVLDAKKHSELMKICTQVIQQPNDYAAADTARTALIGLAKERVKKSEESVEK